MAAPGGTWRVPFLACFIAGVPAIADMSSESYLVRVDRSLERVSADVDRMREVAKDAADRLIDGGTLYAAGQVSLVSELTGRAGGLMATTNLGDRTPSAGDVVLYGLEDTGGVPERIAQSGALVAAFGDGDTRDGAPAFSGYARECGISPSLASLAPAWAFTGELIAELAGAGKMPVVFETIGLPGGHPRIYQYQARGAVYHDGSLVIGKGVSDASPGRTFLRKTQSILERVERENRRKLSQVGEWMRDARRAGGTLYLYSMGHFPPYEIQATKIGDVFKPGEWNSGFHNQRLPEDCFGPNDVVIHIGYQHPPNGLFERARPAGAKVVYVDILEHRDWKGDAGVLWIDPMWPWADAVVDLPGYDIPMLPPSGIVNGAIAWEMYRLGGNSG